MAPYIDSPHLVSLHEGISKATLCCFDFKERLTWAVIPWIPTGILVANVFAFHYGVDGSAESIDQAVVDPCWITAAWVDCQGFLGGPGHVASHDRGTLDVDGTRVALSLGTAGSSDCLYYLADVNRA